MKKIAILFIGALFMFTSCEETESPIYDGSQTLAYFNGTASSLEVEINDTNTVDISVGASTISSSARTVNVSVDADNTSATAGMYSFPATVTIPANEFFGTLTVTGIDDGLTTSPETLTIKIDSFDAGVISPETHTISLVEVCPISDTYMVGDYQIDDALAQIGPANGTSNFESGVVTLTAATATSRTFTVAVLPAFRGPIEITISLVCNTLILTDTDPNLTCNGTDAYIYTSAGADNGSYDASSDQTFTVFYSEDPNGSCGGPFLSSFTLTKI